MIGEVRAAFALLTRIPVGVDPRAGRSGAAAFGIVGAGVGALGALPILVLGEHLPVVAALVAVGLGAAITGALHLDGLADTADALAAGHDPAAAERARRDPAVGSAGAVALIVVIGVQVAALSALAGPPQGSPILAAGALVAAAAVARAIAVTLARVLGRDVPEGRSGAWFVERLTPAAVAASLVSAASVVALVAVVLAHVAASVAGASTLVLAAVAGPVLGASLGFAAGLVVVRARRTLDGDALGAAVELTVAAVLGTTAVLLAAA